MALKKDRNKGSSPCVLNVHKLGKAYAVYPVFQDLSFQVNQGEKVALVGSNGSGKSTLLKIIAGQETRDAGEVALPRHFRVAYLPQEATFESDRTLYGEMLALFGELQTLSEKLRGVEEKMASGHAQVEEAWNKLLQEYATLTEEFELKGGYEYETRIARVLTGLNFGPEWWQRNLSEFSGGEKTRAALARALLSEPDLLMLDEPTNHLDLATLEWLEDFLADWPGTLIVISHDRFFLDRVVSRVMDLSLGRLEDYPGNYSKYLRLKVARRERSLEEYEAQQEQIARTEEFIRRFRNGSRYRQARGRQKQLDRLERLERPRDKAKLRLATQTDLRSGRVALEAKDLTVGRVLENDLQVLFEAPKLVIERGERVAILGPNGCGKSTFLRTVMGELPALEGSVEFGLNVKPGYYAQSHEGLNWERTVLEEIREARPMSEEAARTYLGRFLFSGDTVFKTVGSLSGGERSRVALAKLILAKANFLVLDEPTNHLDIEAREALEGLLDEFEGTILFVSHDRYFIDAVATQIWEIGQERLTVHKAGYASFRERLFGSQDAELEEASA